MNETPAAPSNASAEPATPITKTSLLKFKKDWRSFYIIGFVAIFVGFGAYVIISSFAATDTATKTWSTASDWATGTLSNVILNGNGVVLASSSTTTATAGVSASGTVVTNNSPAAITDTSGARWTVVNGVVHKNGSTSSAGYSARVTQIAYVKGVIWQENSSELWWEWTNSTWSPGSGTTASPLPTGTSLNGTVVTNNAAAAITDTSGAKWTVVNQVVHKNGSTSGAGYSARVIEIAYVKGEIWQENGSKLWWEWTNNTWNPGSGTTASPLTGIGVGTTAVVGAPYVSKGSITLSFNAGSSVTWTALTDKATLPSGAAVALEARSSTNNTTWSAWNTDISKAAAGQYLQVEALLATTNSSSTPTLTGITLSYTLPSQTKPTPTPVPPTPTPTPISGGSGSSCTSKTTALAIQVCNGQLVNGQGSAIQLKGVDVTGTEDACIQNKGFSWGASSDASQDATSATALKSWDINVVRVPLNEDCWLNINNAPSAYSGSNYVNNIKTWVQALNNAGIYTILDLHWTAPGSTQATQQWPMADADHSITFWSQVASTFKSDPAVIYDLFNEPYIGGSYPTTSSWSCWLNGCSDSSDAPTPASDYSTAGMQQMVNAVRAAGANQPIMVGGLNWAGNPCQSDGNNSQTCPQLSYMPKDTVSPAQLVVSVHSYQQDTIACTNTTCWNNLASTMKTAKLPVVAGEIGQDSGGCNYEQSYMDWADQQSPKFSYVVWAWQIGGSPFNLVNNWTGTPGGPEGPELHSHLVGQGDTCQ